MLAYFGWHFIQFEIFLVLGMISNFLKKWSLDVFVLMLYDNGSYLNLFSLAFTDTTLWGGCCFLMAFIGGDRIPGSSLSLCWHLRWWLLVNCRIGMRVNIFRVVSTDTGWDRSSFLPVEIKVPRLCLTCDTIPEGVLEYLVTTSQGWMVCLPT